MISGNIEALSIFKILRSVTSRKMSGTLSLHREDTVKRFIFFQGEMRLSYSNLAPEHLAVRLRDLGLISSIELQDLKSRPVYKSEAVVDEILKDGLVAERRLARIEGALTRERLLQVFEWSSGTFKFEDSAVHSTLPAFDFDITALLVEAAFIRTPFAVCEHFMLKLKGNQLLKRAGSSSVQVEQAIRDTWVFRQSVSGVSLNEIMGDHESRHMNVRAAAAMILSGIGQLSASEAAPNETATPVNEPQPRKAQAPESAVLGSRTIDKSRPQDVNSSSPERGRRVVLKANSENPNSRAKPIEKARKRAPDSERAQETATQRAVTSSHDLGNTKKAPRQREEVLKELDNDGIALLTGLPEPERERLVSARRLIVAAPDLDHYQILGVSKEASPESVRETFRRLAREYHADRFSRYNLPDCVHQLIQLTFVTINASNEVLGDAERRSEYDLELSLVAKGRKVRTKSNRSAPQELNRALSAERELNATLSCLSRGEVSAAKSRLAKAKTFGLDGPLVPVLDVYIKYLIELESGGRGLTSIQAKALDALGAFAASNDGFSEVFLYMGRIYKHLKDQKRALAAFKKAVEISPNLAEASSELRYLQRQIETQGKGLRGLLRT